MSNQDTNQNIIQDNPQDSPAISWLTISETHSLFIVDSQTIRRYIKRIFLVEGENNEKTRRRITGKNKRLEDIVVYNINRDVADSLWKLRDKPLTTLDKPKEEPIQPKITPEIKPKVEPDIPPDKTLVNTDYLINLKEDREEYRQLIKDYRNKDNQINVIVENLNKAMQILSNRIKQLEAPKPTEEPTENEKE